MDPSAHASVSEMHPSAKCIRLRNEGDLVTESHVPADQPPPLAHSPSFRIGRGGAAVRIGRGGAAVRIGRGGAAVRIRRGGATPDDAARLHALAAATFALACPPSTTREAIAAFIADNLAERSFAGYLLDPERDLFIAEIGGVPAGYTMVVHGEPTDSDAAASVTARPTAELSKCYVLERHHGSGVAAALVHASAGAARDRGAVSIWLGVNQQNVRANRFYEKCGFELVGTKRFLVGDRYEDDFVRELVL
jgi:ribosomal protein S18 acetylase RimI-like enzyme